MKQQIQTLTTTFEGHANNLKEACELSGHGISDHFADVGKMIALGKVGQREINDIKIDRYDFGVNHSNYATASHNLGSSQLLIMSELNRQDGIALFFHRHTRHEGAGYVA